MPGVESAADEERQVAEAKAPKGSKKKRSKGLRRMMMVGLLTLLAVGTGIGLHYTGAWDGRTFLFETLPNIPLAGPSLARAFNVPAIYSLTPEERRRVELREREEMILAREASADEQLRSLGLLSDDLAARAEAMAALEAAMVSRAAQNSADVAAQSRGEKEIEELLRVYQEMSPRNAAAIMEGLQEDLSVTLLSKMPQDTTALILAKMAPEKAARLTERLSRKKEP